MARARITPALRDAIRARASGYCEYCRCPDLVGVGPYSVEHIVPESRGGPTASENLAWACPGCNGHKYAKVDGWDAATGRRVALFNPRTQRWSEHFLWSDDTTRVLGVTPTGRATVDTLQLNRLPLIQFRQLLVRAGYLPPPEPA